MTDEPAQPAGPEPEKARPPERPPERPIERPTERPTARLTERATIGSTEPTKQRDLLPILYFVGFVALAGTLFYLWQNPPETRLAQQDATRVESLQTQVARLRDDLGRLQQRPAPTPAPTQAAFDAVKAQIAALETRPATDPRQSDQIQQLGQQVQALGEQVKAAAGQTPDLQPLTQRIDVLEKRAPFDPAPLDAKLAQLGAQLGSLGAQLGSLGAQLGPLGDQTKQIAGQVSQLTDQLKQQTDRSQQLAARVDETAKLAPRLDALERRQTETADALKAAAQRLQVATKLQGAAASLAAGQKLGDIPGAPAALTRFATEAPPTEAALRESFDQYAAAAQKASQPGATADQGFGERLWTRAQQAVTVRQGDRVLLGDPIAGVLAHAREQLDNGSLGAAVETLKALSGPAAAALQPWVDKAQSLVQARAALAALAAG